MPPESLSTLAAINPGPRTAKNRSIRIRQRLSILAEFRSQNQGLCFPKPQASTRPTGRSDLARNPRELEIPGFALRWSHLRFLKDHNRRGPEWRVRAWRVAEARQGGIRGKRLHTFMYHGTLVRMAQEKTQHQLVEVARVQTGVRMEKRMLKVLKAIAEQKDITLGDLLEGIVLHAFEGKAPFSPQTLKEIEQFKGLYGMTLKAADSHHLK